ncbi:MAG TPA: CBS domain-containing protein [Acidimicrobiia bacterium]|nr:CBS domain-containing protein [Acidimicrobiia bacterium]
MAKTKTVEGVMTVEPVTLPDDADVMSAAKAMRDADIGDVIVLHDGQLCGIVTDRDIVVRAIAADKDPHRAKLRDICSQDVTAVSPKDPVDRAVELMRDRALRRLPVVDQGRPVGIVSLGDLAVERDPKSALADISSAPGNT